MAPKKSAKNVGSNQPAESVYAEPLSYIESVSRATTLDSLSDDIGGALPGGPIRRDNKRNRAETPESTSMAPLSLTGAKQLSGSQDDQQSIPHRPVPGHQDPSGSSNLDATSLPAASGHQSSPARTRKVKKGSRTMNPCERCRRLKVKCDGKRPTCGRCAEDYNCVYDVPEEGMRKTQLLKEESSMLKEENANLKAQNANLRAQNAKEKNLILAIENASDVDESLLIAMLRMGQGIDVVLESVPDYVQQLPGHCREWQQNALQNEPEGGFTPQGAISGGYAAVESHDSYGTLYRPSSYETNPYDPNPYGNSQWNPYSS